MNYLLVKTGYEGIEKLIGLFTKECVISKIQAMRKRHKGTADFYCVQFVDAKGAKCVCKKLGVAPSKPMWR